MVSRLLDFRAEDRRDAWIGFVTLVGVMMGHSILETARDTLFLSRLPAEELPWAYIAIAALALVVTAINQRALQRFSRRRVLSLTLLGGGIVTLGFWFIAASPETWMLFALYVWTGLLATVVVVQFWLLGAQVFDVGQAKRVFAFIGAGGLVGATLGSACAGILLWVAHPRVLLAVAALLFAATALVPRGFSRGRLTPVVPRRHSADGLNLLKNEAYLRRVFWLILSSTVLLTGVDFLFKSMVSVDVATDQLGMFFARFYMVVNALALFVQLFAAPRLLRVLGVNGSLLLLPSLLLAGSVGFVLTLGLGSVLVLRAADGALRHSLNRTSTEILYLPLSPGLRDRFKAFAESVGQRGGQALASVMLLSATALGARPLHIGFGLCVVGLVWLLTIYGLKPHYIDLFRSNLRRGTIETNVEVPDLDLHSFEALISALSSENDDEVLGALDILASYGRTNLVPALILYHPSPRVVLRAFELFSDSKRTDVRRLTARLLRHENPEIRAAALRAHSTQDPDVDLLTSLAQDPSPLVQMTARIGLIRAGFVDEWEGGDVLRDVIDGESAEMRIALALAARDLPPGRYAWCLIRLAGISEPGLARAVASSMAAQPDPEFVPTLVRMLAHRECRDDARLAIVALGDRSLDSLEVALADFSLPRVVRRHLPRTISRFLNDRAARILMQRLRTETDEVVVLKILRGLGRMRATNPLIRVNRRQLEQLASETLQRAVTMLFWRTAVQDVCRRVSQFTPSAELLSALLADKEASALERVFRLLQIVEPSEEFRIMYSGLRSSERRVRADSRELLANVVAEPIRRGLLAMVDDAPDDRRLQDAAAFYNPPGRQELLQILSRLSSAATDDVEERSLGELERLHVRCLRDMLLDPSDALSSVASYRIAELGFEELRADVAESQHREAGAFTELSNRAVGLFGGRPEPNRAS